MRYTEFKIIEAYFGKNGNQYNMGRTHINSCDFSLGNYALCDVEDRELSNFSIERDKKMLIPFIKAALKKTSVPLHIMASPWSPPPWMKTNNQMNHGGKLKEEYPISFAFLLIRCFLLHIGYSLIGLNTGLVSILLFLKNLISLSL